MATKVITGKVRASFVHIFEPQSVNGADPRYSCSFIIPKSDTETIGKIRAAIEEAKQNGLSKWGGKIPPNLKLPLRDGDTERPDDPNYADAYFVNANSNERPGVVDRRRVPHHRPAGGLFRLLCPGVPHLLSLQHQRQPRRRLRTAEHSEVVRRRAAERPRPRRGRV